MSLEGGGKILSTLILCLIILGIVLLLYQTSILYLLNVGFIKSEKYYFPKLSCSFPLYGSITGAFLAFLALVFHSDPLSFYPFILSDVYKISFYLDGLSCFFLLLLFTTAFLFLYYQPLLSKNCYFLFLNYIAISFFVAGNFFFLIFLLSLVLLIIYQADQKKNLVYWIAFACLLGVMSFLPVMSDNQFSPRDIDFSRIMQSNNIDCLFFLSLLPICFQLGLFDFFHNEKSDEKLNRIGDISIYLICLKSLIGFYALLRFIISVNDYKFSLILILFTGFLGLTSALRLGWSSLKSVTVYDRLRYLYSLNNALWLELVCILLFSIHFQKLAILSLTYDFLFFGLLIQNLGFALAFLLTFFLKRHINQALSICTFFCLALLLSGFPPFPGFTLLWGNLQLGMNVIFSHYLFNMIFALFFIGCNSVTFLFLVLGWINLLLNLYKKNRHQFNLSSKLSFNFLQKNGKGIRIYLSGLFLLSFCPGIISFLIYPIKKNLIHTEKLYWFAFKNDELQFSFSPVFPMIYLLILAGLFYLVKEKIKFKALINQTKKYVVSEQGVYEGHVDKTSFSFGEKTFIYTLADILLFKKYLVIKRKGYVESIKFYRCFSNYRNYFNLLIWENEQKVFIAIIIISLLLLGFFVR